MPLTDLQQSFAALDDDVAMCTFLVSPTCKPASLLHASAGQLLLQSNLNKVCHMSLSSCMKDVLPAVTLGLASATAREFYKVDAFAGKLLIPYLIWLAFANALNYSIWQKNPGVCHHSTSLFCTVRLLAYSSTCHASYDRCLASAQLEHLLLQCICIHTQQQF